MPGDQAEKLVVELAEQVRNRYYGKYRGIVSKVDDHEAGDRKRLGRIRVKVPEIYGDQDSPWALPCMPYAGDGSGQYMIPPPGAGVWIEFEAGDPARPIWTGCWWGEDGLPHDQESGTTTPRLKILRSEQGLMVALDDDGKTIAVSDDNGNNLLKIEASGGKVTVKAATKAVVDAPRIELVDGASHPLAFGDDLLSYLTQIVQMLNTHTHPGETAAGIPVSPAPPQPMLQPPKPSLLSTKVKTG